MSRCIKDQIPKHWVKYLEQGWSIVSCSCTCGGNYAWERPLYPDGGAFTMAGCVCHYEPFETEIGKNGKLQRKESSNE